MFTGITRGLFAVVEVVRRPDLIDYVVDMGGLVDDTLALGASVAIDGVCQTVVAIDGSHVRFQAIRETLDKTTLDELAIGRRVSVERSRRASDEIGGHDVAGHVASTGDIVVRREQGNDVALCVRVPSELIKYVLHKGFIALDGSSLTVGDVDTRAAQFWVHLIPETLRLTNFAHKREGARVNVELDPHTVAIVDTVERVLAQREAGGLR